MKRKLLIALIIVMVCSFFTACGDGKKPASGQLEFELYNYSREYKVVGLGTLSSNDVVVPSEFDGKKVTAIGENAFSGTEISKVTLPETVKVIEKNAFSYCPYLTKISIPESIESVLDNAFDGSNLLNYTVKDGIKYLGNEQNDYLLCVGGVDKSITKAIIEEGSKIICPYAFYDCDKIDDVIIPDSVDKIEDYAFYGCDNLFNVTLGENLKDIEDHAFLDCNKIVEVFNKSSLNVRVGQASTTGYVAFNALAVYKGNAQSKIITDDKGFKIFVSGSDKVLVGYDGQDKNLVLPDGIVKINKRAFCENVNIVSVSGKDGLKTVEIQAFYNCKNLERVDLPNSVISIEKQAFSGCEKLNSVSLNDNLTTMGDYAFSDCVGLEQISLPASLNKFGNAPFSGCKNLKDFNINANNDKYLSKDGVIYTKDQNTLIQYPAGNARTEFVIGDDVAIVGANAFDGAVNLNKITLGKNVKLIDSGAFKNAENLSEIVFDNVLLLNSMGSSAFSGCKSLERALLPNTVTTIGESAFYGCESLSQVKIDGIESIGQSTFYGCKSLTEITIPDSVSDVGAKAFSGCENLSVVNIGKNSKIYGFGEYCFENCKSLIEITIPKSTQNIQKWAFSGCENLKYVHLEDDGWWAWNKGFESIGVSVRTDPEGAAKDLKNYRCKYLWQNKNVKN